MDSNDVPPPYARTVYDETYRAKSYIRPSIMSMGNRPNLLGQLEFPSSETDGSFGICVANGSGVLVSRDLLESIPAEHRPALDTTLSGQSVEMMMGASLTSIGTTHFPFIISDADTGEKLRVVLYAIVVPRLLVGMFIGNPVDFLHSQKWYSGDVTFTFDFGQGGRRNVKGI